MESNFASARSGLLAGEQDALALSVSGAGVEQVLAALVQAFEAHVAGSRLAVHLRCDAGEALHRVLAVGSAPGGLGDGIDALRRDDSPAWQAIESLEPACIAAGKPGARDAWPVCRRLMQAHGFRSCVAMPLVDSGHHALGVLMRYAADDASALASDGVGDLARAAALLVEHDQRRRQREHEAQQRRETLRGLAHDMRNLLAPLRTSLEVLSRPQIDAQALQRLRSIMARQVEQLAALPDELSRLARTAADEAAQDTGQLRLPTDELPSQGVGADGRSRLRRVLVADDNEHVRASFVELLAAEGFEVRTAADGEQAVEIADQWQPDVVLLDIHMPRLSGLETARRLRATHPPGRMTLLMLSGVSLNDAWVRHAKAAGFDDCLDKSADPRAWLARVRGQAAH